MKYSNLALPALIIIAILPASLSAQLPNALRQKEVFRNDDVVFHQIDSVTWVGTGHDMYNESMYLVEGTDKALLIDAGTNIKDLDKIVAFITAKPVMVVATHVHPDHTGPSINVFPEVCINPADTVQIAMFMPDYRGKISYLTDGEKIDLGGREILVVFTPAHTPGSVTFIDTKSGYGFSGDSFGSGNLLLSTTFSGLKATCQKAVEAMEKYNIKAFYPGHYWGDNPETKQRLLDMITICQDILSGKISGAENPGGMLGLDRVVEAYGVKINYSSNSVK